MRIALTSAVVLLLAAGLSAAPPPEDTCVSCHSLLEGKLADAVKKFESDVHRQLGLGCADCHGGDPADESMDSMSPAKGFRGTPRKTQVPDFCARCHSDIAYMHSFNPKMRADQLSQYLTSVHGQRLKRGDTKVAACVDCHSVHDILPATDTRSPVHPVNLASTCARCHASEEHMRGYNIPTDQVASYEKSVHAEILAQGDTAAPTCATCHGNHGATPPGVSSVANVCGTCHVFFQQLFTKSPHQPAFAAMGLPGCVQCHSNHEIVKPSDDWVGVGQDSTCVACHSEGDKGYIAAQKIAGDIGTLKTRLARAEEILDTAERSGMEVSTAKVELANAHETLIKARVNVHAFDDAEVRKLTDEGAQISEKAFQAGVAALNERDVRRKGLGISLIAIVLAISGLYLKIRQIESRPKT